MKSSSLKVAVEKEIFSPGYYSESYVENYLKVHLARFIETVSLLQPIVKPEMRLVDVGSYGSLVPVFKNILGISDLTLTEPFQENVPLSEDKTIQQARYGERFSFHVDRFDIEGLFPYADCSFDIVVFTEVLEHLSRDPCQTLSEINRITKPGGWLMLSTPNCASAKSVVKILRGGNPSIYPVYKRIPSTDRHNHEYAPWEVKSLLEASGYVLKVFKTIDVYANGYQDCLWLSLAKLMLRLGSVLSLNIIKAAERGDSIFAVGEKARPVVERYPAFLYAPA
jgi:SAM-dependent methyltransferase